MTLYVLDTDILTLYREKHGHVGRRVDSQPAGHLAITVLTVDEQLTGWYTLARRARNDHQVIHAFNQLGATVRHLAGWRILPVSATALTIARQLRSAKPRIKVKSNDLYIAAIAIEHDATVVTRNLRDFQRVPGLNVEDWSV